MNVRNRMWIATVVAVASAASGTLAVAVAAPLPQDKAFTVANYPVEAEAKNAVAAKDRALAEGQQAAFRALLKRIVPVTAYTRMERVREAKSGDFVAGVSVRSERNSATRYIASLDFSFEPEAVRDLLQREGLPFVDAQAPSIVVVPVMRDPATGAIKARGSWAESWKGLDLDNTVTPAAVQPLKDVIHADTVTMLMKGEGGAERILAGEYTTDRVVAAIAEIDKPAGRVHVTLAGRDAVGPIRWRYSYRISDGDTEYALEFAAVVSLGVLEGRWKMLKAGAGAGAEALAAPGTAVVIEVSFNSLSQWNDIRQRLLELPGVADVRVGAVSARSAEVSLVYPGGPGPLADALAGQGLTLQDAGGSWLLRPSF